MNSKFIRSPFFYVGDKYKLMPQLSELFPKNISYYLEPFVGGGSSFLNTKAKYYLLNDIDSYVINLHTTLCSYKSNFKDFISKIFSIIEKYNFSCSYKGITCPLEIKKEYVKTYYSHFNKESYIRLKESFNENKTDYLKLYLLIIYGFNHMLRFNKKGDFNLPVGNVDFNKNVYNALVSYFCFCKDKPIMFDNLDYQSFVNSHLHILDKDSFIYLDPPYLISGSEYNKLWNENNEKELCDYLDFLDSKSIKFGITNLIAHKGRSNRIFLEWSKKYHSSIIKSNYISFNDNSVKRNSVEVYVTNGKG